MLKRSLIGCVLITCMVVLVLLRWHLGAQKASLLPKTVCERIKNKRYTQIVELGPVLPRAMCRTVIEEAEAYARDHGGWERDRHEDYPTTDIEATDIPSLVYPIHNLVYREIVPKMAKVFHLDPTLLGIGEVFIAKYSTSEPNHQRRLKPHEDGSEFSFVVALNDEFEGGGTRFVASDTVYRPSPGSAIAFCGKTTHEGLDVTHGTRYILTGFLRYGSPEGCSDSDSTDD